jgi:hypothetical protein
MLEAFYGLADCNQTGRLRAPYQRDSGLFESTGAGGVLLKGLGQYHMKLRLPCLWVTSFGGISVGCRALGRERPKRRAEANFASRYLI